VEDKQKPNFGFLETGFNSLEIVIREEKFPIDSLIFYVKTGGIEFK